jgi:hypothetical protein
MKLNYRQATKGDVSSLVTLLADDDLGSKREDISLPLESALDRRIS